MKLGRKPIDLTGQRFGRLKVLRVVEGETTYGRLWLCKCNCGKRKIIGTALLRRSKVPVRSCGCLVSERQRKLWTTHGKTLTPEYNTWRGMRKRCYCKKQKCYPRYGGRGIRICQRWRGKTGFANFLADMGKRPGPDYSLDRYPNPDGNYEPGNCRWATRKEQNRNKSGFTKVTVGETSKLPIEWEEETGIKNITINARLRRGWSHEDAVTVPVSTNRHLYRKGVKRVASGKGLKRLKRKTNP